MAISKFNLKAASTHLEQTVPLGPNGVFQGAFLRFAVFVLLSLVGVVCWRFASPDSYRAMASLRDWVLLAPFLAISLDLGMSIWRYLFRLAHYVQEFRDYTVLNIERLQLPEAARLPAEAPTPDERVPLPSEKGARPLGTRERDTMLRIIIGMAIKGYSHSPAASRSTAPKEIADDLAALGISVSDDTVRKYLKEAAESVLPASARQT